MLRLSESTARATILIAEDRSAATLSYMQTCRKGKASNLPSADEAEFVYAYDHEACNFCLGSYYVYCKILSYAVIQGENGCEYLMSAGLATTVQTRTGPLPSRCYAARRRHERAKLAVVQVATPNMVDVLAVLQGWRCTVVQSSIDQTVRQLHL